MFVRIRFWAWLTIAFVFVAPATQAEHLDVPTVSAQEAVAGRGAVRPVRLDRSTGATESQLDAQYEVLSRIADARILYGRNGTPTNIIGRSAFGLSPNMQLPRDQALLEQAREPVDGNWRRVSAGQVAANRGGDPKEQAQSAALSWIKELARSGRNRPLIKDSEGERLNGATRPADFVAADVKLFGDKALLPARDEETGMDDSRE